MYSSVVEMMVLELLDLPEEHHLLVFSGRHREPSVTEPHIALL